MAQISIIMPAYQEEDGITQTIKALQALPISPEIIVVDDGSTDGTAAAAERSGVIVIRHPANAGYGRSLKDGIRKAASDIIVITDADGSYPVDRIPDLVAKLNEGYDMVVGARTGREYRGSMFKMPARIVFKWLVEFATGRRIPDINSGLRVFRKSTVLGYFPDICDGFSFTTTVTLIYMLTGKFVTYMPIEYHTRIGKSKVQLVRDTLRTLQYITETLVLYNPLKLFLLLSLLLGAFAVACLLAGVMFGSIALDILGSASLVGAFLLFGMGLVAFGLKRKVPFSE